MLRFRILSLMGLISTLALGMAALRYPSSMWASAIFTLALVAFTIATLVARFGKRGGFAVGFAICGWLYMGLAFGPWFEDHMGHRLLSTAILDVLYSHVAVPQPPMGPGSAAVFGGMGSMGGGSMAMGGMGQP